MNKTTQLISISDILSEGWKEYKRDWKKLLEISIRFLFAGLIELAFAMIADRLAANVAQVLLIIGTAIAYLIILQTIIVLIDYILQRERGAESKAAPRWQLGANLFWSYLWINFLVVLATLGGFFLLVLPGIWLAILFSFSIFLLIDEKKKGSQALARSAELVKGRWWKVLWRIFVPSLAVIVITLLSSFVLTAVISIFAGGFTQTVNFLAAQTLSPIQQGISATIDSIVSIIIIPLAVLYQVKLYSSLKKTEA